MKILIVDTEKVLPGPSYSGSSQVRWGLIKGLQNQNVCVGYYSASPGINEFDKYNGSEIASEIGVNQVWLRQPSPKFSKEEGVRKLQGALDEFKPDVVLALGMQSLEFVRDTRYRGKVGIVWVDLEFLPSLYRIYNTFIYGGESKGIIKALIKTWNNYRKVINIYPKADFIINHAAHHADWHRRRHGKKTLYVPNPVPPLFNENPHKEVTKPARFILLGGLGSVSTTSGLGWFAQHVYPLIEPKLINGEIEIHLIGRHTPRGPFVNKMQHLIYRGYVEDLGIEMLKSTALLVPTPIKIGFRTRILEAFRYGVAVIAHEANAVGMPELKHEHNALLSKKGKDFADAILRLTNKPIDAITIGNNGFSDFSRQLNSDFVGSKILEFIDKEVLYGNKHFN